MRGCGSARGCSDNAWKNVFLRLSSKERIWSSVIADSFTFAAAASLAAASLLV